MSNSLAVAATTATFANLVESLIAEGGVPGARVTHLEPNDEELTSGQPIVNLFLMQVTRNPSLYNQSLPVRRADASVLQMPTTAIELNYLVTFYGNQATLEPQRLLGCVVAGLNAEPLLSPALIARTIIDTPWLAGADLATAPDRVRLSPIGMTAEQMAQIWYSFFDFDYCLSLLCQASGLMIAWPQPVSQDLPARRAALGAAPMRGIAIDGLVDAVTGGPTLVAGATMAILGRNLAGAAAEVVVLIDERPVTPTLVAADRIEVPLDPGHAAALAAGSIAVRVQHRGMRAGQPTTVAVSPVAHATLHPAFVEAPRFEGGTVTATVVPPVAALQPVALLLNPTSGARAGSGRVDLELADGPRARLVFPVAGVVAPGDYLVQVAVAGTQTLLATDDVAGSPTNGRYVGPVVTVTA